LLLQYIEQLIIRSYLTTM